MTRAPLGDPAYWTDRIDFDSKLIAENLVALNKPSVNPVYDPQFCFNLAERYRRLILRCYSRGDPITALGQHFVGLLDTWELSNRLADEVCRTHHLKTCRDWIFDLANLNHYNWCFWLVGLALTLDIPDDQWNRLVALIDAAGQDELLDRVMATRQRDRVIGTATLHPKPYARLLKTIDSSKERQPAFLCEFVDHWYVELARKGKDELWWYVYGDPVKHPLSMGSYFGRWCIEAAVVAKVFQIDDTLCLGHEYYPGDLLRPNGPTTHPDRQKSSRSLFSRLFRGKCAI